ncbi:MAG: sigma-70 family RNA polymerase sigma factor [Vampirovibrionales bacterium]|nr:sigma-70 family RNA polymerase sigma factor [Vampirovibrionales bacterium]
MSVTPPSSAYTRDRMTTLDVEALVTLAQQRGAGRMAALEELVRRYQKTVYAALYHLAPQRADLADLTQDALLRMCRSIHTLRSPKTFKFWLNRIITNIFYDELRKKPRSLQTVSMDAPWASDEEDAASATRDIADTAQQPDFLALGGELDEQIRHAITTLPEHFRTIVVLREIQGLSYEEIASLTGSNLGTVKSRLARARQKLQEALEPYIRG